MDIIMFSLKDLGIVILCLALLLLIIYLIVVMANLIKTLKKANSILDDVKVVSEIASNKAVMVENMLSACSDEFKKFLEGVSPAVRKIAESIATRIQNGCKRKEEKEAIKQAKKEAQARVKKQQKARELAEKERTKTPSSGLEVQKSVEVQFKGPKRRNLE